MAGAGMRKGGFNAVRAIAGGALYAGGVFSFAFITGAIRTILVAQDIGITALAGVIVELPLILSIAWLLCELAIEHSKAPATLGSRAVMGATALVMIIGAEMLVSLIVAGHNPSVFVASYHRPEALLGLIGQIVAALFPLLQMKYRARG